MKNTMKKASALFMSAAIALSGICQYTTYASSDVPETEVSSVIESKTVSETTESSIATEPENVEEIKGEAIPEEKTHVYNVSFEKSDHGSLKFPDTDKESVAFEEGEKVDISVLPNEGYHLKTISLVGQDGQETVLNVTQNSFSFEMEAYDITVKAEFEKDDEKKVTGNMVEEYIADNLKETINKDENNNKKAVDSIDIKDVSGEDLIDTGHTVFIMETFADHDMIADKSLDAILYDKEGEVIAAYEDTAAVYEVSENNDYYVAFVDINKMNKAGTKYLGSLFTTTDTESPVDLKNEIKYDSSKGIMYIPKSLYFKDGKEYAFGIRAQVVYSYDFNVDSKVNVSVNIENNKNVGIVGESTTVKADTLDYSITIPVVKKSSASKVSLGDFKVFLNDSNEEMLLKNVETSDNAATAFYDKSTGELTLAVSPSTLKTVKIEIGTKNVGEKISGFVNNTIFKVTNAASYTTIKNPDQMNLLPDTKLSSVDINSIKAGQSFNYTGYWYYTYAEFGKYPTGNEKLIKDVVKGSYKYCYVLGSGSLSVSNTTTRKNSAQLWELTQKNTNKNKTWDDITKSVASVTGSTPSDRLFQVSYNFAFTPPSGKLTSTTSDKTQVDFGSYKQWKKSSARSNKEIYNYGLAAHCSHINKSNNRSTLNWKSTKTYMRILYVDKGENPYMVVSFSGGMYEDTGLDQAGIGMYKVALDNPIVEPDYGVLTISKQDTVSGNTPQGNATFTGTTFSIYNASERTITLKDGRSIVNGGLISTLKIPSGNSVATDQIIPYGSTVRVVESQNPEGYEININEELVSINSVNNNATIKDSVKLGSIQFTKFDKRKSDGSAQGKGDLDSALYGVYNNSNNAVYYNGNAYGKDQKLFDLNPKKQSEKVLPVGSYYLLETKAPEGYQLDTVKHYFEITSRKLNAELINGQITDTVVRGNFKFVKTSETGRKLGNIPFSLKSNTTNEEFLIETDENGYFESKGSGVWFGAKEDKLDSDGALPYDTYTLTEQRCEANKGMNLITKTFTIDGNEKVLDLGTIINHELRISTSAKNKDTGTQMIKADKGVNIIDTVSYENLNPDVEYTISGTLMDKDTNSEIGITASTTFVPRNSGATIVAADGTSLASGTIDVVFENIDLSNFAGKYIVVFESLKGKDGSEAYHKDIADTKQTISVPEIGTKATDGITDTNVTDASEDITIVDKVSYSGLEVGKEYTVNGKLMDKDTGNVVLDDKGKEVTASTKFTAEESKGTVTVTFKFSGVKLEGKTLVAFESVEYNGHEYAVHADINDENQTVHIPHIKTSAVDNNTGIKNTYAQGVDGKISITDTVTYENLVPDKEYTLKAVLMDKDTKKAVLDKNGKEVTSEKTFTPKTYNGSVDVIFEFEAAEGYEDHTFVAYERLYLAENVVEEHEDINDVDQTVYVPKVHTNVIDEETDSQNFSPLSKTVTLIDTVHYTKLIPGTEYTVKGTVMDKATKEPLVIDGETVTNTITFTPETADGTVDVPFTFNPAGLEGKTLVVFEEMYYKDALVGVHKDIDDKDQTVYAPTVETKALDSITGTQNTIAFGEVTIVDTVHYTNLIPGRQYTMKGVLMDKETGEKFLVPVSKDKTNSETDSSVKEDTTKDDSSKENTDKTEDTNTGSENKIKGSAIADKIEDATVNDTENAGTANPEIPELEDEGLMQAVEGSTPFIPEEAEGDVEVRFTFNADGFDGRTLTIFEQLYIDDHLVGNHEDINAAEQMIYIPKIGTTAIDDQTNDHISMADDMTTITDTVHYENLIPGNEYTVKGLLIDKETKEPLVVNGQNITGETIFTPETPYGDIDVVFTINTAELGGHTLVAYESLIYKEHVIAKHEDPDDEDQTIYIPKIGTTLTDNDTKEHIAEAKEKITLTDVVSYENLIPGKTYTVVGKLMDKSTGEELAFVDADTEEQYTAERSSVEFTPENSSGTVDVPFTLNASQLGGKTLVAYEYVYLGTDIVDNKMVAIHTDINDVDQTVVIPGIGTTLIDNSTLDHVSYTKETVELTDTIKYTNLIPGKTYTISGKLIDKESGNEIKAETDIVSFIPENADGTVDVKFKVNTTDLAGRTMVAFERIYLGDQMADENEVARHEDPNDSDQSVFIPKIGTTLVAANGKHQIQSKGTITLTDTIKYENLIIGKKYTVKGTLVNKKNKNSVAESEAVVFTPEKTSGEVKVTFKVDASKLANVDVVAFEKMYITEEIKDQNLIATHEDINDKDQTVTIKPVPTTPKTGDMVNMIVVVILLGTMIGSGICATVLIKKKRR